MSNTKIVIICLILLMAIFFIGLSLNLIQKPNDGLAEKSGKEQQKTAASYNKNSWVKAIDGLLAPFAASLTPEEISLKNCSKTKKGFILNEQSPGCKIMVPGFGEIFKKLSLKPNNRATKLNITYKPTEGDKEEFSWPTKDHNDNKINFVILGKEELQGQIAATIFLECSNCSNDRNVKVTFD